MAHACPPRGGGHKVITHNKWGREGGHIVGRALQRQIGLISGQISGNTLLSDTVSPSDYYPGPNAPNGILIATVQILVVVLPQSSLVALPKTLNPSTSCLPVRLLVASHAWRNELIDRLRLTLHVVNVNGTALRSSGGHTCDR